MILYSYCLRYDDGAAPNPYHGICTLTICKPAIRRVAKLGDWVVGMGGSRLKATGRCVFAMCVSEALTLNDYWSSPTHLDKRPVRNGSRRMMVGDNIYHYDTHSGTWAQADSHHSNLDGTRNIHNTHNDTSADRVLISSHFFYFGQAAPIVPDQLLKSIGYRNGRNYRVFDKSTCSDLLAWLHCTFGDSLNLVLADPFDFENSSKRYSVGDNTIR